MSVKNFFSVARIESLMGWSLFISILAIPFPPNIGTIPYILLALLGILRFIKTKEHSRLPFLLCLLVCVFLVRIVGLFWAPDLKYGLSKIETSLPLILYPLAFVFIPYKEFYYLQLLRGLVTVSILTVIYSFYQLGNHIQANEISVVDYLNLHLSSPSDFSGNMLNWKFAHYSFLSLLFLYGLIVLLFSSSDPMHKKKIRFALLYSMIIILFMIFTGARSGLMLTLIVWVTYLFIQVYMRFSRALFWGLLISCALAGSASIFFYIRCGWSTQNDFTRYQYAVVALTAWKEKPLLGHGTGSSKAIMRDIDFVKSLGFVNTWQYNDHPNINHPHNQYINELLQFGIIGSLPLLLFFCVGLSTTWRSRQYDFFVFLLIIAIFMLIEAPLHSNKGLVPFTLITSLLAIRMQYGNSNNETTSIL